MMEGRSSTTSLVSLTERLFTPNLKPPRVLSDPMPPSLAGSRLPPPCAEVDERPPYRIRRFRLWAGNSPSLRLVVLDPRRRNHLRRYQSYPLPSSKSTNRGVSSTPVYPPLINKGELSLTVKPLTLPRTPYAAFPNLKISKAVKKLRYQRLLQYKYALDQEHERRFRRGMTCIMLELAEFETGIFPVQMNGPTNTAAPLMSIDIDRVIQFTQFFKDVRKKSTNIYKHLALRGIPIYPVHRREDLHKAVREEERHKERKKEKQEAKRLERELAEQSAREERDRLDSIPDIVRAGELDELDTLRRKSSTGGAGDLSVSAVRFSQKPASPDPLRKPFTRIILLQNTNEASQESRQLGPPIPVISDTEDNRAQSELNMNVVRQLLNLMTAAQKEQLSDRVHSLLTAAADEQLGREDHAYSLHQSRITSDSVDFRSETSIESSFPETITAISYGEFDIDEDTAQIETFGEQNPPATQDTLEFSFTEKWSRSAVDTFESGGSEADTMLS